MCEWCVYSEKGAYAQDFHWGQGSLACEIIATLSLLIVAGLGPCKFVMLICTQA